MSGVKENGVSEAKKAIREFACWYAIIIPFACALLMIPARRSPPVLVCAAFTFSSALLMGVFCLFGRPVGGGTRSAVIVSLFASAILGGFASYAWYMSGDRVRFRRDMEGRYERQCGQYYKIYETSDIEGAKKALQDTIDFSIKEQGKAKYYWRFDTLIAGADARLAIIAEAQGEKEKAKQLFASASDHQARGNKAFREEAKREGHISLVGFNTNDALRMSPDQWRKWIAALEKHDDIKWKSTTKVLQPAATHP